MWETPAEHAALIERATYLALDMDTLPPLLQKHLFLAITSLELGLCVVAQELLESLEQVQAHSQARDSAQDLAVATDSE